MAEKKAKEATRVETATIDNIVAQRIEAARKSNSERLDLSGLGLNYFPLETTKVPLLRHLDLSNNNLSGLPTDIGILNKLTEINLSSNKFSEFPTSLGSLILLENLNLSNNYFEQIPSLLENLINLKVLLLQNNKIKEIPIAIAQLTILEFLNVSNNYLTAISEAVFEVVNLLDLDLSNNFIKEIPDAIKNLVRLKSLKLAKNTDKGNYIQAIPLTIRQLHNLNHLDLRGNPLPLPPEILKLSNQPQSIIDYYISILENSKEHLNEIKLIIVGQGSVGKTSLVQRILFDTFREHEPKTEGISISHWEMLEKIPNKPKINSRTERIKVNLWDFGGQEIMHATHQFFLTKRSLYLLVLDARLTQEENRVEYWLKIIQSFSGDSPIIIVGNKSDQHPLDIDRTGLKKKYANLVDIIETSAANGTGVSELKNLIAKQISVIPHVKDSLPGTWFSVKLAIENLRTKANYLTLEKYLQICMDNGIKENNQKTLIGFLHDLGIILYFQDEPRLQSLGILNPHWVTNGVYRILNSHTLFQNKGVLEIPMLNVILGTPEYPYDKRLFIIDMMRKFELCYDLESDKSFLVPDLLPKDEPFTGEWKDALTFQYHYNVLPTSIVSRFIVRMNTYIYKTVWRTGVILKMGGNTALVRADIEEKKVFILVVGDKSTRRDFLAAIRTEFDAIHKTIVKIEAREKVSISNHPEIVIDYEHLLNLERLGETSFIPEGLHEHVNVRELLNGIAVETERHGHIETFAPSYPVLPPLEKKPQPKVLVAIKNVLSLSKPIGRFIFDIFGRHDAADTSSIIMGWIIIAFVILLFKGFVQIDAVVNIFKDIWQFFFPV